MKANEVLVELDQEGVRLTRTGDDLHVDAPQEFNLEPWLPHLRALKPALLAALDLRELINVHGFDTERACVLYARSVALDGVGETL